MICYRKLSNIEFLQKNLMSWTRFLSPFPNIIPRILPRLCLVKFFHFFQNKFQFILRTPHQKLPLRHFTPFHLLQTRIAKLAEHIAATGADDDGWRGAGHRGEQALDHFFPAIFAGADAADVFEGGAGKLDVFTMQVFRCGSLSVTKLISYFAATGALVIGNKAISIRRFWLRPAAVSLLAMG